jgi:hypothetical protein
MKRAIILAGLLVASAGTARSAIVYLKDGGHLDGTLVSSTGSTLILDTAQGRVSVDMNRVQNVDYGSAPAAAPAPAAAAPLPPAAPQQEEYRGYRRRRFAWREDAPLAAGSQMLSVDFGLAAPLSNVQFDGTAGGGSASDGYTGPAFGLQYLYYTSPRAGWGVEFDFLNRGYADSTNLLPAYDSRVYGNSALLLGVVKYSLTDRGPLRPFVVLGAGAHETSTVVDAYPLRASGWPDTGTGETRRLIDGNSAGFAATVRLGLDFGFFNPSVFSLEAGWTGLTSGTYQATSQGNALGITGVTGALNYFTFTGRWGLAF